MSPGSYCVVDPSVLTPGLYTSPHLCAVRERIRVNGEPLSEEEFAKYFFEVWERLEADPKVRAAGGLR